MSDTRLSKISIRTRLLVIILTLIAVIFLVIFTAFNVLVDEYIKSSANEELEKARAFFAEQRLLPQNEAFHHGRGRMESIHHMRMMPGDATERGEAIIITADYELIFPAPDTVFQQDYNEKRALAAQLEQEQVDLQSGEIMRLRTSQREYSLLAVGIEQSMANVSGTLFLIYYIDMTAISSFAERINTVLLWVMGIAGILAVTSAIFVSNKIAEPIKELSRFARRMGKGDFSKSDKNYKDAELAELAESMNKAAGQLETYDKEQKKFFQNVSHELRTPLQSIRFHAEGVQHEIIDEKKSSRVIISEIDRLSELVEDILYLSRIDSITGGSNFEEVDLREVISNCAERQRILAEERGVDFVFDFDERPVNFYGDEKHLGRAFNNLISNAIRYAGSKITFSCRRDNRKISIAVTDDGKGIPEKDLPHIFDRFYRGTKGKYGIGLSIARSVIEQHGGHIEVSSSSGEGTSFIITF